MVMVRSWQDHSIAAIFFQPWTKLEDFDFAQALEKFSLPAMDFIEQENLRKIGKFGPNYVFHSLN